MWSLKLFVSKANDISVSKGLRLIEKGIWWMPWYQEAMKEAEDCHKLRGAVNQALIRRFPNGETYSFKRVSLFEYIE